MVTVETGNRSVRLTCKAWSANDLEALDGCFLTPHAANQLGMRENDRVCLWSRPTASLSEFLAWIEDESGNRNWQRVAAVPSGYEDEGVFLQDWTERDGRPMQIEMRFTGELDFADIRGWRA